MIDLSDKYLMMIEPMNEYLVEFDELANKAQAIKNILIPSEYGYRGWHTCSCGKASDNKDWLLPNGVITNSLFLHYVMCHRQEIPQSEIDKIEKYYKEFCT